MTLEAEIPTGYSSGFPLVAQALQALRTDFRRLVGDLEPDEWHQPSRCHLWDIHDVVRHVRDGIRLYVGVLNGGPSPFHPENPFENREAPLRWLAATTGESPSQTVGQYDQLGAAEHEAVAQHQRELSEQSLLGPYGPVHWTIMTAHIVWDSWLHTRDITEALDRSRPPTLEQDLVAAHYGVLVATIPAMIRHHPLDTTIRVTANCNGPFDIHARPGYARLQPAAPGDAPDLVGELNAVVDALTGRGSRLEEVLAGQATHLEPFTWLRGVMTPAP